MRGPQFATDETALALGLIDNTGLMVPTDVKRLKQGQVTNIKFAPNYSAHLLSVLKKSSDFESATAKDYSRLSAVLVPMTANYQPEFIPLMDSPIVQQQGLTLNLKVPQIPNSVQAVTTYSLLSKVVKTNSLEKKIAVWEVYNPTWVDGFTMPTWPESTPIEPGSMRWDVSFVGTQRSYYFINGPELLLTATHLTHAATDF